MIRYILTLLCIAISTIGISQTNYSEVTSDPYIVGGLYNDACEALGWEESWESDCVTAANYYVDTLQVPEGAKLTSITINVLEDNTMNPNSDPYFSYGQYFPGGTDGEGYIISSSDWNAPGIAIIDTESQLLIEYIHRSELAGIGVGDYSLEIELWQGEYEIRIINESLFDNAVFSEYFDTFDGACSESYPEFCWLNQWLLELVQAEAQEDFINVGQQDIVVGDIVYNFEAYDFEELSISDVSQPFVVKCDESFLDWENQPNGGYDCILSGEYYVKEFSIPYGKSLESIRVIPEILNTTNEEGSAVGTYANQYDEFMNDQEMLRGFYVMSADLQEIVFTETRRAMASQMNDNGFFLAEGVDISSGDYVMYIIHDEGDNIGYGENWIDIDLDEGSFEILAPNNVSLIEGPEIVLGTAELLMTTSAVNFDDLVNETHQICSDSPLDIGFGCNSVDGMEFLWEVNIPGTNLWPGQDFDCTYNFQEPYDTSLTNWNVYDTRVIVAYPESYDMEPDTSDTFQIEVMPNPSWDFEADALTFEFIDPDLLFSVILVDLNYPDDEIDGDYNWSINNSWEGASLELDGVSAGGYSADFLFNPFISEEDTIASFIVDATSTNGCYTMDTTYLVYMDLDGDETWSVGDSINFRSFLIIDTTVVDTTVFMREFDNKNIKLYPNPTQNTLTLEHDFTGPVKFRIISMTGAVVRNEQINTPIFQTSVGDLQKGIYIVTITDGIDTITSRLVKTD
ncbi:MAG: T9SS type A sorting domain-containing protein [bacterium]|nr:T9SS type A sorting domain-containing protein [bacterium]